jgi:hypothetical protein
VSCSRRGFALGAVLLLAGTSASAAEDLTERIRRARSKVRSLRGPFEQTRTVGLLATDVHSKGTLTLVRPERLRWELAPPDEVTFWVGPEGLAYRSAHGHGRVQAGSADVSGALDDLRAVIGGDVTGLRERWEMRVLRDDATGAEIEATPKPNVPSHLQRLRFALAPDLVRPTRALLVEGPRDRTSIEFGPMVIDGPVDDAEMRPPP